MTRIKMEENLESLFEVEGRPIVKNSIHAIRLGPSLMRAMLTEYDSESCKSTWMTPGIRRPMVITLDSRLLKNQTATSGKQFLSFAGEIGMKEIWPDSLTPEQREIYDNWNYYVEKAGYGGLSI